VRRLNNEATSFYFTNFPDDVVVVDLWKIFARFGRVGEVYIPSKKDKWGRGFGFVKFFEVENAERLESRLGEVWCGTYKLRINLSRFGRKSKLEPRVQPYKNALVGGDGSVVGGGGGKGKELGATKGVQGVVKTVEKEGVSLELEPDMEFVYALENSSVGRIIDGKNIKQVQFNLCMEGYRNIRVANLGEG
jgi:RNA recognition motif-containing protein